MLQGESLLGLNQQGLLISFKSIMIPKLDISNL